MFQLPLLQRTLRAVERDLGSEKVRIRLEAIRDLSRGPQDESSARIALLVGALHDAAPAVRQSVLLALADHGTLVPLAALLPLLTEGELGVRQMALVAVGECAEPGDEVALGAVRPVLHATEAKLRFQAISAYIRLNGADAEDVLVDATEDEDSLIRELGLRLLEERAEVSGELRERTWKAIEALSADENFSVRLLSELVRLDFGLPAGSKELLSVIERRARPSLPGDEQLCVELAGRLRIDEARAGLLRRARGFAGISFDPFRYQARAALAALGEPGYLEAVQKGLRSRAAREVNLFAFSAGRVRLSEVRADLEALVGHPERVDEEVLRTALRELESTEKPENVAST